ncbi:hydroxymethylglutaryl-CoA lyase [Deinococcus cellulosilyticus]|uniref:Hydroxymethylglutaryl-CoA lyase n=1 Tax=Deinococcus cellulosilyticus (strain DSM 18568 / NBRC 106333 / KACC 11606 / 5516J-15) TaxID=1223518 RepID=A0A511N406_DEIC1|nr:hydroxymethylglutaryl-CoA lyase [Deinococcus cellulosilyticus]GEM47609.1 hydroxymethylglutaryl-CoA lyase [Deinococcus cellulosilyticus NBRC 106333 = KACC 11606]
MNSPLFPEGIKYVECPRDAWQGLKHFIPTETKVRYIHALLDAGFTHLDLGSFVSPKAVPQMQDTEDVLRELPDPEGRDYLCIIANEKGMDRAAQQPKVTSVGFPLSISETFQLRNARQTLPEAWHLVERLKTQADAAQKGLVVYLSMGFGNPYGDPWNMAIVLDSIRRLRDLNIPNIALADTVGTATPDLISEVCSVMQSHGLSDTLGLHLHARPEHTHALIAAGWRHGIRWFEGAIGGFGGCPFAADELVGNLPTEQVLRFFKPDVHVGEETLRLSETVFCDPSADI